MPKVSVLVPIFNVEQYLEQCLDSIVNQTLEDIEIICINDGSTDGSLKIIKRYAKKDPRIVIIDKKNSGYGDSMNKGLEKATGDYIGIVESDDWIELDAFEKLYALGVQNSAEVVKSNFYNYFTDPKKASVTGTITHLVSPADIGKVVNPADSYHIFYQRPAIWSAIYQREFLVKSKIQFLPSAGASYQDTGFNFKVWSMASRAVFTEDAFLHYRQDNEASSVNSPGKVFCVADEFAEIEQYLKQHNRIDLYGEIMRIAKWGAYAWNIERLTADLAKDFILRASEEYKRDQDSGVFNFEHCDVNQVRAISELIANPEMTIKRKNASEDAAISVIMAAYNTERYIKKSIDSILNQSLANIELIIVDDGSTDRTSDIIEDYYHADARVTIINQHNNGQSSARNRGIERANAEFIAFPDSDDYYELDALQNLYDGITKNNADMCIGSIRMVYENNQFTAMQKNADRQYYIVKFRGQQNITDAVLKKTDVSPCNKLFRTSIINEYHIRFPEGLKYEDAYFFHAYAWCSKTAYFLDPNTYVYNYVRRPGSTMSSTYTKAIYSYDHTEIAEQLFTFLREHDLFAQHANYATELFREYLHFTLRHTSNEHHEYTYNRAHHFIENNENFLSSVNPSTYKRLLSITSFRKPGVLPHNKKEQDSPSTSLTKRSKDTSKTILRKVLPKFSVSYRSQKRLTSEIHSLRERIDSLEKHQDTTLQKSAKDIYKKLDEIARRIP